MKKVMFALGNPSWQSDIYSLIKNYRKKFKKSLFAIQTLVKDWFKAER